MSAFSGSCKKWKIWWRTAMHLVTYKYVYTMFSTLAGWRSIVFFCVGSTCFLKIILDNFSQCKFFNNLYIIGDQYFHWRWRHGTRDASFTSVCDSIYWFLLFSGRKARRLTVSVAYTVWSLLSHTINRSRQNNRKLFWLNFNGVFTINNFSVYFLLKLLVIFV